MKKILIVLTNTTKYPTTNRATGIWFGEAVHFIDPLKNAGFSFDYASPLGGYVNIDPHSLSSDFMSELDWKYLSDRDFMNSLVNSKKLSDLKSDDYEVIYFVGGHGVLWDFKDDKDLIRISSEIYKNGGIISAVCHGVVGLLNIKIDNEYLIKDKFVTGFSNSEEDEAGLSKFVPYLPEDEMIKIGAKYQKAPNWQSFAISDNRVVTGQNPSSGKAVADEVLKILNEVKI